MGHAASGPLNQNGLNEPIIRLNVAANHELKYDLDVLEPVPEPRTVLLGKMHNEPTLRQERNKARTS